MTSFGKSVASMSEDEATIKITRAKRIGSTTHKSTIEKVLRTSFDDGTEGIYILDLTHDVRVWVCWKRKK